MSNSKIILKAYRNEVIIMKRPEKIQNVVKLLSSLGVNIKKN